MVKRILLWGEGFLLLSLLILFLLSFNNPFFIDSVTALILYFLILPFVLGAVFGLLSDPVGRLFRRKGSSDRADRPAMCSVNGLLFGVFLLYLFVLFLWSAALALKLIAAVVGAAIVWLLSRLLRPVVRSVNSRAVGRLIRPLVYAVLIVLLVGGTLGRLAYLDHQRTSSAGDNQKLMLLGFDGSTWKLIKPMMQRGELPNFTSLVENGCYANLESLDPMLSPQIWGSIASGKLPEKHGILDFLATTEDVLVKRIWDILGERGHTVGIFGYFTTSPPYPVNGFMIPSHQVPGSETYPEKYSFYRKLHIDLSSVRGKQSGVRLVPLAERISMRESIPYFLQAVRYGVRLSTLEYMSAILLSQLGTKNTFTKYRNAGRIKLAKLRISSDIFAYLTAREMPDLAIYYNKSPDNISHPYWKFLEPEKFPGVSAEAVKRLKDMIPESYREADRALGKFLRNRTRNQTVLVCSDHGFKAADTKVYSLRGYTLLKAMGLQDSARVWSVMDDSYLVLDDPELQESIVKRLTELTFGEEGHAFLEAESMPRRPGYYKLVVNPELIHSPGDGQLHCGSQSLPLTGFLQRTSQIISGVHAKDGVLLVNGPPIKEKFELSGASVLDVTPTILALFRYPIARDFDGKVLNGVFEDDFFAQAGSEFIDSYEEETTTTTQKQRRVKELNEDMIQQLKALGYLR
jgi:predicted AlkP superfamily phosphohydrolase/phosphomutase